LAEDPQVSRGKKKASDGGGWQEEDECGAECLPDPAR